MEHHMFMLLSQAQCFHRLRQPGDGAGAAQPLACVGLQAHRCGPQHRRRPGGGPQPRGAGIATFLHPVPAGYYHVCITLHVAVMLRMMCSCCQHTDQAPVARHQYLVGLHGGRAQRIAPQCALLLAHRLWMRRRWTARHSQAARCSGRPRPSPSPSATARSSTCPSKVSAWQKWRRRELLPATTVLQ